MDDKHEEQITVMMVDDEPDLLESCQRILEDEDYRCLTTTDSSEVMSIIRKDKPCVILTDYLMPGKNGVEVLKEVKGEFPNIPVVMISAYATVSHVVEAVKIGAFDYITKPFSSDQLIITVKRAVERACLHKENATLKQKLNEDFFNRHFVGKHPKFLNLLERIKKVAVSEANVLIEGETGTGKELAAKAIHMNSKRAENAFIVVECYTLTKEMLDASPDDESAVARHYQSMFDAAKGGTIYLEQVEELSPAMQARLLRILQDMKTSRSGEWEQVSIDVRFIASCSANLQSLVEQEQFRENLYYCLNVIGIQMPPLRERKEDIEILCDHFFHERAEQHGEPVKTLNSEALARLMQYDWPGNVRELRNAIERAASIAEGDTISALHLPDDMLCTDNGYDLSFKDARKKHLGQFEKLYLENLLRKNKGNISRASEESGITRTSLYRMLKRTSMSDTQSYFRRLKVQGRAETNE